MESQWQSWTKGLPLTGGTGTRLSDLIADKNGVSPLEAVIHDDLRKQIHKVLASLTPKEAKVLRKRFGIDEKKQHTMEELGREFGVTRERIRQIQNRAIAKLKHPKKKDMLRGFLPTPTEDDGSSPP